MPQLAEREGFEPPDLSVNGFQDRRHKPLGHLSIKEHTRDPRIVSGGDRCQICCVRT